MIRIVNLRFRYPQGGPDLHPALDGLNLQIPAGQYLAVVGHNGSGKSTLARHLNALLLPSEGEVWVEDLNTADPQQRLAIRQRVGMVFQSPDNQLIATTVEDDVAFGPENLGLDPDEIEHRVEESLREVGMLDFRLRSPHQLSSGQKQRVAIAGALAMRPRCLVLDEATSLLDPQGRADVLAAVERLHRQGMTVITITHSMPEAARAQRVLVLDHGQVAMDGRPVEVFHQVERLRGLGLDAPPMLRLAILLRKRGLDVPAEALTMGDLASYLESSWQGASSPVAAG